MRNSPLGDEEDGLELELTLDGEVLDGKMLFPVVSQTLVKCAVFLGCDVGRIACPDWLGLVELLVGDLFLLDLLSLLVLLVLVFINLLNLGLFAVFLFLFLLVILNFLHDKSETEMKTKATNAYLLNLLRHSELDGI